MLVILKAQLETELARDTQRSRKSFYHCIKRINEPNGGPLLNGVGITARSTDKAIILGVFIVFIALVFTQDVSLSAFLPQFKEERSCWEWNKSGLSRENVMTTNPHDQMGCMHGC